MDGWMVWLKLYGLYIVDYQLISLTKIDFDIFLGANH